MSDKKKDISATVNILKRLDTQSLLLIDSGARLLAARQEMDSASAPEELGSKELCLGGR